ncbi:MAG: helix-turn-helix domain-containing protein [Fibrobacterota bacterium]
MALFSTATLSGQSLSEPRPFSVFKSEAIRLVAAIPQGKKAKSVIFYVVYGLHTKNGPDTALIGTVERPPYAILWDASFLPDQDMNHLRLYCDFIDEKGLLISGKDFAIYPLVLDRHDAYYSRIAFARFLPAPVSLFSGDTLPWNPALADSFPCGNNQVFFQIRYTEKEIAVFIFVKDRHVVSFYTSENWPTRRIWEDDFVQLSFDVHRDRGFFLQPDDRFIRISPRGFVCISEPGNPSTDMPDTAHRIIVRSRIFGGQDHGSPGQDSGYALLVRIPFDFLGKKAWASDTLGFNIHITDKEDDEGDLRLWGSLSGATRLQYANPSEWAQLVFLPPKKAMGLKSLAVIFGILTALGIFLIIRGLRKKRISIATPEAQGTNGLFRSQIEAFVRDNALMPDLTLESAAARFHYSKGYFGKTFKQLFDESFVDHISRLRIEEAKKRLLNSKESVSQIAYAVGYENPDTFLKAFKRLTGLTPTQYRDQQKY